MNAAIKYINVNPNGGVPKFHVESTLIQKLGPVNDKHNDKHHGGFDRAVLLYSIEQISKLQEEGHHITPGSTGENLTIKGLAWEQLKQGDILKIGEVKLELTFTAPPCPTIEKSFKDNKWQRMNNEQYPGVGRWCAKVLEEGKIVVGDTVEKISKT